MNILKSGHAQGINKEFSKELGECLFAEVKETVKRRLVEVSLSFTSRPKTHGHCWVPRFTRKRTRTAQTQPPEKAPAQEQSEEASQSRRKCGKARPFERTRPRYSFRGEKRGRVGPISRENGARCFIDGSHSHSRRSARARR